jgi:hypothetical protein
VAILLLDRFLKNCNFFVNINVYLSYNLHFIAYSIFLFREYFLSYFEGGGNELVV